MDNTYISNEEQKKIYNEGQKLAKGINAFATRCSKKAISMNELFGFETTISHLP